MKMSRRLLAQLGSLQSEVVQAASERNTAFRIFVSSRHTTTATAQREFWLEFLWLHQEYRMAVRRLAQFCAAHSQLSTSAFRTHPGAHV